MMLFKNLRRRVLKQYQRKLHVDALIRYAERLSSNPALTRSLFMQQDTGLV